MLVRVKVSVLTVVGKVVGTLFSIKILEPSVTLLP